MLEDHILLEQYMLSDKLHIKIAYNTLTMAQVGPITPPAALTTGAAVAPLAIQQAPMSYREKFAGMGDLYGGAYLPLLQLIALKQCSPQPWWPRQFSPS